MKRILAAAAVVLAGCVTTGKTAGTLAPSGSRYVAMGSSYAAGDGAGPLVPGAPKRCGRTTNNYAHLLAARMHLDLVDASCGGAKTSHILGEWVELPPQLDSISSDTRLVTLTIGGNDLNYIYNLMVASCGRGASLGPSAGHNCPSTKWPSELDYNALAGQLRRIAREVARRAPNAELVFVDYVRILPEAGGCAALPLDQTQMAEARTLFRRMAALTRESAQAEGAIVLPAGELSLGHDACSVEPWSIGYSASAGSWHPTAAGHAAIADALAELLSGDK